MVAIPRSYAARSWTHPWLADSQSEGVGPGGRRLARGSSSECAAATHSSRVSRRFSAIIARLSRRTAAGPWVESVRIWPRRSTNPAGTEIRLLPGGLRVRMTSMISPIRDRAPLNSTTTEDHEREPHHP